MHFTKVSKAKYSGKGDLGQALVNQRRGQVWSSPQAQKDMGGFQAEKEPELTSATPAGPLEVPGYPQVLPPPRGRAGPWLLPAMQ